MRQDLRTLAEWLGAELHGDPATVVTGFATDSGSVQPGDLFLAFKGARVDGHQFVPQALASGAAAALVSSPVDGVHLLVPNVLTALARMASHLRDGFTGPVVAITGSAGKTTTKEFVATALSPLGPILKTEGNRNSEYTSPLLWTDLEPAHRAVVVEMAMRGFGQIRHLASFSRPTVGVVTNVGFAHLEMVGSREGIADAKGELLEALPDDGTALLWYEDDFRDRLAAKTKAKVRTFGFSPAADCRITRYRVLDWDACSVQGELDGEAWEARLPAVGRHMGLNAAAAVLAAQTCGVSPQVAAEALANVALPPMRMQVVDRGGVRILLDNYNASPPSMIAALETLGELPTAGRRLAVIGEMRELGDHREAAHRSVGRALAKANVDDAILLGDSSEFIREEALRGGMPSTRISIASGIEEIREFLDRAAPGDAVLVKGSRALELERAL